MKKLLTAFLVAASVVTASAQIKFGGMTINSGPSIRPVVSRVSILVGTMPDGQSGRCTAFAVDRRGTWVTAQHCVDNPATSFTIGDADARLEKSDEMSDLAILFGPRAGEAFKLGRAHEVGDVTQSMGYMVIGNIFHDRLFIMPHTTVHRRLPPPSAFVEGTLNANVTGYSDVYSGNVARGHSGSPILNQEGRVVGVVTTYALREHLLFSPTYEVFRDFTEGYWK